MKSMTSIIWVLAALIITIIMSKMKRKDFQGVFAREDNRLKYVSFHPLSYSNKKCHEVWVGIKSFGLRIKIYCKIVIEQVGT